LGGPGEAAALSAVVQACPAIIVLRLSFPPLRTPCPFLPPRLMPSLCCIPEYHWRHDGRVSRQSRGTLWQGCLKVTRRCWGLEQTILLQARVTVQGVAPSHLSVQRVPCPKPQALLRIGEATAEAMVRTVEGDSGALAAAQRSAAAQAPPGVVNELRSE
jgi:hypothetical protein